MIEFPNGGRLIQDVSELPEPPSVIYELFADFETTSKDPKLDALDPWNNCWVAGIAVTWDDMPGAVYVPLSHWDPRWNLPRDKVIQWFGRVLARSKQWVNHHVKYESHVAYKDLGLDFRGDRVCTVVRAKIFDSDRMFRGGYGLDALSTSLLHEDIDSYGQSLQPYLVKNKDYGRIPADICGAYACQDVITNRRLHKFLLANMPEESSPVVATETKLTSLLVRMERRGLLVRPQELLIKKLETLTEMVAIEQRLHELVGYPFIPTSNPDCYDVLCNRYGLPVLAYTEIDEDTGGGGNPSFDADALEKYKHRIDAPREVVEKMIRYRKLATFKNLFLATFIDLSRDVGDGYAIMHPDHNQCVRTGRMSVKKPNSQQQDKNSKKLFHPGAGMSFFSSDASQIEFRVIISAIRDDDMIRMYCDDPDVDFHQKVADMCPGLTRRPGKTINFSVAFGQGKGSTVEALSVDEDVVKSILQSVEQMVSDGKLHPDGKDQAFKSLARQRGEALYDTYHETFPGIRRTAKQAMNAALARGYIKNIRGRRRYLPKEYAHKGFNSYVQSSAADIIKERMIALDEMYQSTGISEIGIVTQVHDEVLSTGPTEVFKDPRFTRDCVACLEDVHILRVPLRFKYGVSDVSWFHAANAAKDGGTGDLSISLDDVKKAEELSWLKQ
jgi:DNA polymerase I-like protein with 3'-5' exonuclease and polymerase domains